LSLRINFRKLFVLCWMFFIPVLSLLAAKDSTALKFDTAHRVLREPSQQVQQEIQSDDQWKYITEDNKSSSEDGFFDRLLEDLMKSLFEQPDDPINFNPGHAPNVPSINWWSIFFIVVGAGLIVFFIIKATGAGGNSLFKGKTKRKEETVDATLEDVDIHTITYDDEIARAKERHDYRFAVRLWFLRSLKEMSDLQLINWKIDKTNSDYYYELAGSDLQKQFGSVSLLYDYVWYGKFPITALRYRDAEAELSKYVENIKSHEAKKK
jgi:hypothetical protein